MLFGLLFSIGVLKHKWKLLIPTRSVSVSSSIYQFCVWTIFTYSFLGHKDILKWAIVFVRAKPSLDTAECVHIVHKVDPGTRWLSSEATSFKLFLYDKLYVTTRDIFLSDR